MIKLVAFDWNGTLLADTQAMLDTDNYILPKLGRPPIDMKALRENFEIPVNRFYNNLGISEREFRQNKKIFDAEWHGFYEPRAVRCRTRAGARQLLLYSQSNKINIVLFSNHILEAIYAQLTRLRIDSLMNTVLANTDTTTAHFAGKEKRLAEYIKHQGYKPSNVMVVGDTSEEIEVAKGLGATSVALSGGNYTTRRLKTAKPDYLISNLRELIPIIENLK